MSIIKFCIIIGWCCVFAAGLANGLVWALSAAHPDQWMWVRTSAFVVAVSAITLYGLIEKDNP